MNFTKSTIIRDLSFTIKMVPKLTHKNPPIVFNLKINLKRLIKNQSKICIFKLCFMKLVIL